MEVNFTQYLAAADVGYTVVLYLWLMVSRSTCHNVCYSVTV
jgi:hypothetical protein